MTCAWPQRNASLTWRSNGRECIQSPKRCPCSEIAWNKALTILDNSSINNLTPQGISIHLLQEVNEATLVLRVTKWERAPFNSRESLVRMIRVLLSGHRSLSLRSLRHRLTILTLMIHRSVKLARLTQIIDLFRPCNNLQSTLKISWAVEFLCKSQVKILREIVSLFWDLTTRSSPFGPY